MATLQDRALGVSAVWGKSFQSGGRELGHVMDPRLGHPVSHTTVSALLKEAGFSLQANRKTIESVVMYATEQGLIKRRFAVEELFDDTKRKLGA